MTFSIRPDEAGHREDIARGLTKDDERFRDFFKIVFGNHVVSQKPRTLFWSSESDTKDQVDGPLLDPAKVTSVFHADKGNHDESCYRWPGVTPYPAKINGDVTSDARVTISRRQFLEKITTPHFIASQHDKSEVGECNVNILVGRIGTGKSTLLSNIIIAEHRFLVEKRVIPLRFDVEEMSHNDLDTFDLFGELFVSVYQMVENFVSHVGGDERIDDLKNARKRIYAEHGSERPDGSLVFRNVEEKKKALNDYLVCLYREFDWKVLLMIDNLDGYYYKYDSVVFTEKGRAARKNMCQKILEVSDAFMSESSPLCNSGANVVLVMRRYVFEYMRMITTSRASDIYQTNRRVFRVVKCSIAQVIESRLALFRICCKRLLQDLPEGQRKALVLRGEEYFENILNNRKLTRSGLNMLQSLENITHHGHRSVVYHFARTTWGLKGAGITDRFFTHFAPTLLVYMLKKKKLYHPTYQQRFPNIFQTQSGRGGNGVEADWNLRSHDKSYWIQYLICCLIRAGEVPGDRRSGFSQRKVVSTLVNEVEPGSGYFEPHVLETMGMLGKIDAFNILEPFYVPNQNEVEIKSIRLTDRGRYLVNVDGSTSARGFAFSFVYLQIIVDDPNLQIPKFLLSDFLYDGLDYNYLVSGDDKYQNSAEEMIVAKAKKVFLLIEILDSALSIERARFPSVFNHIDRVLGNARPELSLPDMEEVRQVVTGDINGLLEGGKFTQGALKKVQGHSDYARSRRREIDNFMSENYLC